MAENSGKATIIVTLITVVGGIITAIITTNHSSDKKETAGTTQAVVQELGSRRKVNVKGIYTSDVLAANGETEFFRFYPDGVVVNQSKNLAEGATDIKTLVSTADLWLNKSSLYAGMYSYDGDGNIEFSLNNAGELYRYTGRIDEAGVIKVNSTGPYGPRVPENLSFTPFPE